ncbi:bifunctional polysaccharide deacetylase/glycosyltransferase family 2 protein [Gordonia sp. NPDC003424]
MTTSPPVFYDKTGKRLRRVIMTVLALIGVVVAVTAWTVPAAMAPVGPADSDPGFARQTLAGAGDTPGIGDWQNGVFTRLLRVERTSDNTVLLYDAATGEYVRNGLDSEDETIGNHRYVVDHSVTAPDRTLMLTFDDGPDPIWTPQVLDLLAEEHIPATFFVVGKNVANHPALLKRTIREGHMVGNHTVSHLKFGNLPSWRDRAEIVSNDRLIRATAGYATPLFRIPTGDPDHHPVAQLEAQSLGYLQVDFDMDTNDWRYDAEHKPVPVPKLDGKGHVVLMHDAGGNRSGSLVALKKLIAEAKAQGYTFTTLAPILPKQYLPQHISPSFADYATGFAAWAIMQMPGILLSILFWVGTGSLVVMSLIYLLLALVNVWRTRRREWPDIASTDMPFVTVLIAAYNERTVITRTLDHLRASDHPAERLEVIAIDDGSTDDTLKLLQEYEQEWSSLRVVHQANSGKSSALNNGINHADPRSTVIVTMDADTLFRRETIRNLARHFVGNRKVGAVAGHVKVGNRRNLITAWQSLEYISGICVTRMAEMTMGAISIVPGACSAWRREALERIGGFCDDTLAEDADATLTLQSLGYTVLNENEAICDTEAPETMRTLARQRKRWTFGNIQSLWKHRRMMFRLKHGLLGMVTLPYAALSLIFPLLFLPITLVVAVLMLANGDWEGIAAFSALVLVVHMLISIVAVVVARERWWHLAVVPIYRLIYEPLRAYLLYASAYRVIKGTAVAWDKLERHNSVVAHSEGGGIDALDSDADGISDDRGVRSGVALAGAASSGIAS